MSPRRRSRRGRPALLLGAVLMVLAGATGNARADEAAARVAFKRGIDLYDKKQYAAALESFQKAYAERPSPGIKQNIALSLMGLGRNVEAATALDEALDEGRGVLKAETRAAMEQALAELTKSVATVRFTFASSVDHAALEGAIVSVDGQPLSAAASRRPVRLAPGIHVFAAHVAQLADPPEKKLSLLAGAPVDATFEHGAPVGALTVLPSVPGATVQVDGQPVAPGAWPVTLREGSHRVVASAPGFQTTTADVAVSAGVSIEYPLAMLAPGDAPGAYGARATKPPKPPKRRYVVPMVAYEGQSFRHSLLLQERPGGSRHAYTGGAFLLRFGYHLDDYIAVEAHGEIGQMRTTYHLGDSADESSSRVLQWQLAPGLRFTTTGPLRLTVGTYFGIHGQSVTTEVAAASNGAPAHTYRGGGVSVSWLGDLGVQIDVGSLFLELVGFLDVHGVGTTREDVTDLRMFYSSPSTRVGARLGLGIPF
ncbi:MAG: hypothetical protein JWP97_4628 [Labilithrix sp.]|nr:hypothetical protein [Labilithrix sp.]